MEKLSVVIMTLNAEAHLFDCLQSVEAFADEIIILDSYSSDQTETIASNFTTRFFQRRPERLIEQMRVAVELATHNWVFCIDQDERASPQLQKNILDLKKVGFAYDGYAINRLNFYLTDWFKACGWYPDAKLRLFNRMQGKWIGNEPHYKFSMNAGATTGHLTSQILHYSYRDLSNQIMKMEQFATFSANDKLSNSRIRFLALKIILDPLYRFIRGYFFEGGFREGMRGFICAWVQAFYVFCKYAKVWEGLQYQKGRMKVIHPEKIIRNKPTEEQSHTVEFNPDDEKEADESRCSAVI